MASLFRISSALADEVCTALGAALPSDAGGVETLFRAWSAAIPFDPVAKMAAVRHGRRPPGEDPVEVAERWFATGLGSTCWGHCTLLAAVLDRADVRTSLGVQRSRRTDGVVGFHVLLLADLDGTEVVLDPLFPSGAPLPHRDGAVGDHRASRVRVVAEPGTSRLVHHLGDDPAGDHGGLVVIATDLDADDARAFLSVSATHSGMSERFFLRRVHADRRVKFTPTDDGTALLETIGGAGPDTVNEIADVEEGLARAGVRPEARALIEQAGLLEPGTGTWATAAYADRT